MKLKIFTRSIGNQLAAEKLLSRDGSLSLSSVQCTPKYMLKLTRKFLSSTRNTSRTWKTRVSANKCVPVWPECSGNLFLWKLPKLKLWCICFCVWKNYLCTVAYYCGDKFGDFHQNVDDFFIWTPGHTECFDLTSNFSLFLRWTHNF